MATSTAGQSDTSPFQYCSLLVMYMLMLLLFVVVVVVVFQLSALPLQQSFLIQYLITEYQA